MYPTRWPPAVVMMSACDRGQAEHGRCQHHGAIVSLATQHQAQGIAGVLWRERGKVIGSDQFPDRAPVDGQHLVSALQALRSRRRCGFHIAHVQRQGRIAQQLQARHRHTIAQCCAIAEEAVEGVRALHVAPAVGREGWAAAGVEQRAVKGLDGAECSRVGLRREPVPEVPVSHVGGQPVLLLTDAATAGVAGTATTAVTTAATTRRQHQGQGCDQTGAGQLVEDVLRHGLVLVNVVSDQKKPTTPPTILAGFGVSAMAH